MLPTIYFPSAAAPFVVMLMIGIVLRIVSRLVLLSTRHRSQCLFSETAWLPRDRYAARKDGEDVLMLTNNGQYLFGSFFRHTSGDYRGVVLFCHELNGNRYGVNPYLDSILSAGFDLLTFDFRGHGDSQHGNIDQITPRVTVDNVEDVQTAIDWLRSRFGETCNISLFGMGKGATVALCAAGKDTRVTSVVLDGASPEGRLFSKTCWGALVRCTRTLIQTGSPRVMVLLMNAIGATILAPFRRMTLAWHQLVLSFWCNCRFVNTWTLVQRVTQPILIVHGHKDSKIRADQINAFRNRMRQRPEVWFVSSQVMKHDPNAAHDLCCKRVVKFLENTGKTRQ